MDRSIKWTWGFFSRKIFSMTHPLQLKKVKNTDAKSEIFQSRGGFVELFKVAEVS